MAPSRQRIVLIDDSANDLAVAKRFLERRGYDVAAARSGEEGIAIALEHPPDVIVVDRRMPGMDGFEVARRIKSDPQLQTIPVLMLTGSDSAEDIVEGLGAGADDFVTKGAEIEILFARLQSLLRMKTYQDQLRRFNQQMRRDLQIARRVQEALVPQAPFHGPQIEIRSAYMPSESLSGDFYDYFVKDDLVYLFVADVSGHGLPAAILVSMLKSYIHTEASSETSLANFMARLNDFLFSVSLPAQFATAQLFRIDPEGNLVFANAAHPPFLLHCVSSGATSLVEEPSNLLGALPAMRFEERSLRVSAGDILFAYTDGLTDRRNEAGEFYSIERIAALLDSSKGRELGALYDAIYEEVNAFVPTDDFKDDIAFVLARFG